MNKNHLQLLICLSLQNNVHASYKQLNHNNRQTHQFEIKTVHQAKRQMNKHEFKTLIEHITNERTYEAITQLQTSTPNGMKDINGWTASMHALRTRNQTLIEQVNEELNKNQKQPSNENITLKQIAELINKTLPSNEI